MNKKEKNIEIAKIIDRIINFAKGKPYITWIEITDLIEPDFLNSPEMEIVLEALSENEIQIIESEINDTDDEDTDKKDSVSLYIREIEKVNPLTPEQEAELLETIETGKNIIIEVIKNSGIIIPEFFVIAQKAFSRIDIHEPGKTRNEINEEMENKRRLNNSYGEHIKPVLVEMKQYMCIKKSLFEEEQVSTFFTNEELRKLRAIILPELKKVDLQTEELDYFSQKYRDVKLKIEEYCEKLEKKTKELKITNSSEHYAFINKISSEDKIANLEQELNLSIAEICEIYTQIQKINRKLQRLEFEFENTLDGIIKTAEQLEYGHCMMEKAKNQLLNSNLPLVVSIANEYINENLDFFDLIKQGNIALIKAIENFDYREKNFSTYVEGLIRKAITEEGLPLDTPIIEDEDSIKKKVFELIQEQLRTVLFTLPPREQEVIKMRFGLEEGNPLSVKEIALYFDSTPKLIRQIETKALKRLGLPGLTKELKI